MPPRTRGCKTVKASQENIDVEDKKKLKITGKATKQRKVLADKTNSASDDNLSPKVPTKIVQTNVKNKALQNILESKERPRRERKLPNRYNKNEVLINISNNSQTQLPGINIDKTKTPVKQNESTMLSPFKTPIKETDTSLITNRPKRVCRLPSKFADHSFSPNKFIPVGCHASTPIVTNCKPIKVATKAAVNVNSKESTSIKTKLTNLSNNINYQNSQPIVVVKRIIIPQGKTVTTSNTTAPEDTNNNVKERKLRQRKDATKVTESSKKLATDVENAPKKKVTISQNKNFSFRVLEKKKKPSKRDNSHLDVYEFTYDPNEEPPPQKKKRKRVTKPKPPKPKTVILKSNYDQNLAKALVALKNVVTKKPVVIPAENEKTNHVIENHIASKPIIPSLKSQTALMLTDINKGQIKNIKTPHVQPKNVSTRVEDIAADFEPIMDHNDIDYSPVNSPNRGKSPDPSNGAYNDTVHPMHHHDPLNLRDDLSFFDDIPVASSSMNTSIRRPHASPWRVQFEQLPIKWQVNTYVKANMTPAVESSFINIDESKKKHVYTNMVPELNEDLPEITDNQRNLKQTSIITFIREVVERSASKKKRPKSVTPVKVNSVVGDSSNTSVDCNKTPKKAPIEVDKHVSNENDMDIESNEENSNKKMENKSSRSGKEKNKDGTYFGFDDSENQENVSPVKVDNPRIRALRPRGRAVLQEINAMSGPSRAKIPLAAKTKIAVSSDVMNKAYEQMKSASDAPVFPEKNTEGRDVPNVDQCDVQSLHDDDSQSVHLFEDIEIVHHLKPTRKSYGKVKKATFQQTTNTDSEYQGNVNAPHDHDCEASDEDDLADLTFTMPNIEQKTKLKKKVQGKKKQQSKKEKAEMEAWAAQFNSMCEDIEEFPLVVE